MQVIIYIATLFDNEQISTLLKILKYYITRPEIFSKLSNTFQQHELPGHYINIFKNI
jgi:hypothetical protein